MAIQARLYSDNLAFPFIGDDIDRNPPQDLMENACGLNDFYLYNIQQQQQQFHNQHLCFDNGFVNKPISMHTRSPVAAHFYKENHEIEKFISLQNERLRIALQAQRKQQLVTILKSYESQTEQVLRQKDEEIKRATSRRLELEDMLRRTDMERQKWQMVASETEAMVMNLNKTIEEQVNENNWKKEMVEDDQGSCCNGNNNDEKNMICKTCFKEESCVVMLPCRHLCLCKSCDVFLHSCPVCNMVKKATIQVSFSDFDL